MRNRPPFRADHVGSLLPSPPVKEARARHERREIGTAELKAIEDREIEKLIKKQEAIGLKSVTDGEFRRAWWHLDFLERLQGCELYVMDHGIQFAGEVLGTAGGALRLLTPPPGGRRKARPPRATFRRMKRFLSDL